MIYNSLAFLVQSPNVNRKSRWKEEQEKDKRLVLICFKGISLNLKWASKF